MQNDALVLQPRPFLKNGPCCQVYYSETQYLHCHHSQGNLQEARLYGPTWHSCNFSAGVERIACECGKWLCHSGIYMQKCRICALLLVQVGSCALITYECYMCVDVWKWESNICVDVWKWGSNKLDCRLWQDGTSYANLILNKIFTCYASFRGKDRETKWTICQVFQVYLYLQLYCNRTVLYSIFICITIHRK